jgi:hypothetical protein
MEEKKIWKNIKKEELLNRKEVIGYCRVYVLKEDSHCNAKTKWLNVEVRFQVKLFMRTMRPL